jgi:GntR family transcriptional regulator
MEEHLQEAAEIARTSGISLGKAIELLTMFYQEEE